MKIRAETTKIYFKESPTEVFLHNLSIGDFFIIRAYGENSLYVRLQNEDDEVSVLCLSDNIITKVHGSFKVEPVTCEITVIG